MQPSSILSELHKVLPPEIARVVYQTLRRDAIIWTSLQDELLFQKIAARPGDPLANWSPAGLASMVVAEALSLEELTSPELCPLPRELRPCAVQAYEEMRQHGKAPVTLRSAGLAALALRERRRLTGSWQGMVTELMAAPAITPAALFEAWRTPLACLYGMTPDPMDFMAQLVSWDKRWPAMELLTHILLCNQGKPATKNPHAISTWEAHFAQAMISAPKKVQHDWLRYLHQLGENELAHKLANRLLQYHADHYPVSWTPNDHPTASLHKSYDLALRAGLHRFAGQVDQAYDLIDKARDAARFWMAGLNTQLVDLAFTRGAAEVDDAALAELAAAMQQSALLQDALTLTLGKHSQFTAVVDKVAEPTHPYAQIIKAATIAPGEGDTARLMAKKAVAQLLKEDGCLSTQGIADLMFDWQPGQLIQILFDLNLIADAKALAQAFLTSRPTDLNLLSWLSQLCQKLGLLSEAIEAARTALVLDPFDPARHRRLADLWEIDQAWQEAYNERMRVLELAGSDRQEDQLAYIHCAIRSGNLEKAYAASREMLAENPNHGMANTYLGWTLLEQGHQELAINTLSKATLLIPEKAQPWLMLSEAYQRSGEHKRAVETLRAGVLSAPESPEINFSLASACLASGSLSEALPFLKKAASLTPNNLNVTLELGNTLLRLGHMSEACQVLSSARQKWISHPDLAHLYIRVLLAMGEPEKAIPLFDVALSKEPPQVDWYLLYAETLLGDWETLLSGQRKIDFARLVNAQQALEKALDLNPEDFRAHLLLAETLTAKDHPDAAIEIYQRLVEITESDIPGYYWRVQGGFGKVALQLGQVETALVALQEATNAESNRVYFQRLLTEAYLGADLKKEAIQVARDALRAAPNDLETLSWFADIVVKMDEMTEAVEALECATQLAPDEPLYWLRLAELHLRIGNLKTARKAYQTLVNLETIQPDHLQQAAYGYLRMEDKHSALTCLQKAVEMSDAPSADLLFATGRLLLESDHPEDALHILQKAIAHSPLDLKLHVFHSDLLAILDRPQAALACLEHAVQLKEAQSTTTSSDESASGSQPGYWMDHLDDLAGIHARIACLMRRIGDPYRTGQSRVGHALLHAEKALEIYPQDVVLRLFGASLAMAQMKWHRAEELATIDVSDIQQTVPAGARQETARLALFGLKLELALRADDDQQAAIWIEELKFAPETPRLLAARAILAARNGEWKTANELFERARATATHGRSTRRAVTSPSATFELEIESALDDLLLMAEAALEAHRWEDALIWSRKAVEEFSQEVRAYFEYARKIVMLAERQRICYELDVKSNAPGESALNPDTYAKLETLINQVEALNGSPEMTHWSARGRAVFNPTYINARALMAVAHAPNEQAALVGVLRMLGNYPVAIQVAGQCGDEPLAVFHQALCLIETQSDQALAAARKCLDLRPSDPVNYALLARAAEQAGDYAISLEALEAGLSLWPNEPAWHAWAARLAVKAGVYRADIDHLCQAVRLDANQVEYALALARAYLSQGDAQSAIEALKQPQYLECEDANVWLALAEAHQAAGQFKEALQYAELAAEVDSSPKPVIRGGEIALAMESNDAALEYARLALERDARSADVVLFHSKVMKARGDLTAALEVIQRALPGLPDSIPVLLEQASLSRKIEGPAAAVERIEKILKKDPESIDALALLAHTYYEMGEMDRTEATIHAALRLDSGLPDLNHMMGNLQIRAGQLDQAIHYLSEAVRQAPGMLPAYLDLGKTYQERREHQQALHVYQQAIEIAPNDPRPYYQSALIMREGKDYVGAEAMLRKASKLAPNDVSIRRQLGAIIALNLVHTASANAAGNSNEVKTYL
jgi:tetratricopeptide (TPR) repeat protein